MIQSWERKLLSHVGCAILVRHCLTPIPTYLVNCGFPPFLKFSPLFCTLCSFLWGKSAFGSPCQPLMAWDYVSLPQPLGGFGIRSLHQHIVFLNLKHLLPITTSSPAPSSQMFTHLIGSAPIEFTAVVSLTYEKCPSYNCP